MGASAAASDSTHLQQLRRWYAFATFLGVLSIACLISSVTIPSVLNIIIRFGSASGSETTLKFGFYTACVDNSGLEECGRIVRDDGSTSTDDDIEPSTVVYVPENILKDLQRAGAFTIVAIVASVFVCFSALLGRCQLASQIEARQAIHFMAFGGTFVLGSSVVAAVFAIAGACELPGLASQLRTWVASSAGAASGDATAQYGTVGVLLILAAPLLALAMLLCAWSKITLMRMKKRKPAADSVNSAVECVSPLGSTGAATAPQLHGSGLSQQDTMFSKMTQKHSPVQQHALPTGPTHLPLAPAAQVAPPPLPYGQPVQPPTSASPHGDAPPGYPGQGYTSTLPPPVYGYAQAAPAGGQRYAGASPPAPYPMGAPASGTHLQSAPTKHPGMV